MQLAEYPKLDFLQTALDCIAAQSGRQSGVRRPIIDPLRKIECRIRLWINVRRAEAMAKRTERGWQKILSEHRSRKHVFSIPDDVRKQVNENAVQGRKELQKVLSDLATVEHIYPRLVTRMQVALERTMKIQCDYIPLLICDADQAKIAEADEHYAQGTLMDFETFANGLQRH